MNRLRATEIGSISEPKGNQAQYKMPALTLKSLPQNLLESLRAAADGAHRSLNKEVIHRLERSFESPAMKTTEDD